MGSEEKYNLDKGAPDFARLRIKMKGYACGGEGKDGCASEEREELASRLFFFSSRRRHTRFDCDWSSDVCSSDLHRRGIHYSNRFGSFSRVGIAELGIAPCGCAPVDRISDCSDSCMGLRRHTAREDRKSVV